MVVRLCALVIALVVVLVSACGIPAAPVVPRTVARTNALLSFAPDWECVTSLRRSTCEREIAAELRRIFAPYDVGFWTTPEHGRIDGITIFFETSDPELWGAGPKTVGYSPERCAPEMVDGVIVGASVIFCGPDSPARGTFCADVTAHEIGHLLGLEHVLRKNDRMSAICSGGPEEFGHYPTTTVENRCRDEQDDSALLLAALGAAP